MLDASPADLQMDRGVLVDCIEACVECAQACSQCADDCLSESAVSELTHCIGLDLTCADICAVTARTLSRRVGFQVDIARAQLEACAMACRACGEECAAHGDHGMAHCAQCAERCRACERACRDLLGAMA
ncbi:MAG: four-helix bundle copper-binding protein [Thermoleophilia bacterium]